MRIIIDLQGTQSPSTCLHGSGSYLLSLALAITKNRGKHEIIIALNNQFPESIDFIRTVFKGILPSENIRLWSVPSINDDDWFYQTAELIKEAFFASLKPDLILIDGSLERTKEGCITPNIGEMRKIIPMAIFLYDLIAEVFSDTRQLDSKTERRSLDILKSLGKRDILLTNSECSRQTALKYLSLSEEQVVNIDDTVNDNFIAIQEKDGQLNGWDLNAIRTIHTLETWFLGQKETERTISKTNKRPRLAFVSPLPPERSGISYYSAELLPALSQFYEIDVIVAHDEMCHSEIIANHTIRSSAWFIENGAGYYDRVLYHFGNSQFHEHMFELIKYIPGIIVLHDFFLSDVINYRSHHTESNLFNEELYYSHGYQGFLDKTKTLEQVVSKYPCNLRILQHAKGVFVHSNYSQHLAKHFYGVEVGQDWVVIPHLRKPCDSIDKIKARKKLGLNSDAFIVCSFGILSPHKENLKLIEAWSESELAQNENCNLIFVGQNNTSSQYGQGLLKAIDSENLNQQIHITGWCDETIYLLYLEAADLAVQLRKNSRGETSGTVLDCLNYGIPTIINAHGSQTELPDNCVWKLPEHYTCIQLKDAIESLWNNKERRVLLGDLAQNHIKTHHNPYHCARQYHDSIEKIYDISATDTFSISHAIAKNESYIPSNTDLMLIASNIAQSIYPSIKVRQLFVDVSALINEDLKTGVQRVTRSILINLLETSPLGYRVEPVYATPGNPYRYARRFTLNLLSCSADGFEDTPIEAYAGDVFLGLDLCQHIICRCEQFLTDLHRQGVSIYFIIYDLLPILMPKMFFDWVETDHHAWMKVISKFDGAICISKSVADDVYGYLNSLQFNYPRAFKIGYFHLGADIENSIPTKGINSDEEQLLQQLSLAPTFIMVGTVEPRKGHQQVLRAFEVLWKAGVDVKLVLIGKKGWMVDKLVHKLHSHPQLFRNMFWLKNVSDEYLEKLYAASSCLIAASEGEGFGLPLIEAAKHKLPILARDINVFRELAGNYATFFNTNSPLELAEVIKLWLHDFNEKKHTLSEGMPWLTWEQSTQQLVDVICNAHWYRQWHVDPNEFNWNQRHQMKEEQCN